MSDESRLRKELVEMLRGGHAHAKFDQAVEKLPLEKAGIRPTGLPHSVWQLVEHMRLAQEDILRFSESAEWVSPAFPDGYWPKTAAPRDRSEWEKSIKSFRSDLAEFEKLVEDTGHDLFKPFPWGQGQTLFREALLIGDHNAYHLGQIVDVRRALGAWPG